MIFPWFIIWEFPKILTSSSGFTRMPLPQPSTSERQQESGTELEDSENVVFVQSLYSWAPQHFNYNWKYKYRNTFKLREMYYQYTHVVENNAQHKWRAERVTRAVHYSPPHACIGNTSQAIYKYLYYIYFIK